MIAKPAYRKLAFFRVFLFALSAFIFNTTEFLPVALLSDIAQSFAMPVSQTGMMITVYAWVVSLMSLPFMLLTARVERRKLLIWLFAVYIVSHLLSVVAWNFAVLLVSRVGVAFTHAIFWSITASLVIRVAPKDKKQQALGLLALGSALAMVLGLPLGRMIGQWLGWRTIFLLIALVALVAAVLMWRLLPHLPSKNVGSLASLPSLWQRPMLKAIYLLTMIAIAGHFTAYSYIEPFMLNIVQLDAKLTTLILLVFGLSGFLASFLFGRFYAKYPTAFLVAGLGLVLLPSLCLLVFKQFPISLFVLIFIWGVGISAISLAMQMKVLQLAPEATDVATAIYSGIYNIGIGAGALLGKQVMDYVGLQAIGVVGAILVLIGLTIFLVAHYRYAK